MDKNNDQNVIFFKNTNNEYHQDEDKPSLYLHNQKKNYELKALFYFNNGVLNREDDNPAINIYKDNQISVKIWLKNGKLHRENNLPAVLIKFYETEIKAFFLENLSYNTDKGSLIITDFIDHKNIFTESFFINRNHSDKGFNRFYKDGNLIKLKESGQLNYNAFISQFKTNLKHFIEKHEEKYLDMFLNDVGQIRQHINQHYFFDNNLSEIPSRIRITANGKVDQLEWLIKNGLRHRKDNPAVINYESLNYTCKFYEYGKPKEDLFNPYSVSYSKEQHKESMWYFHNKDIQQFYRNYNLNPFDIDNDSVNLVIMNFKQ